MAVVAPSFDDLLTLGKAEAQTRRGTLGFRDGDITEAQLHACAAMSDKVLQVAAEYFKNTFIDGASGDALTALVDDHCNIQRKGATPALVSLSLSRTSGGSAGTILAGTQFATDGSPSGTRVTFTLDSTLAVGAGNNGPFLVGATAADTGTEANVVGGSITRIIDPVFDSTFTVTQPTAAAGGNTGESDEELRKRAKLFFLNLRRGTLAAIEFGALLISSVRVAHAIEDPDTFEVLLVVSDSDGGSTLDMESDVEAEVENWRCAGAPVRVEGGFKQTVDLTIKLVVVSAGFDAATVIDQIAATVEAKIDSLGGGEVLYLDWLVAAVIAVAPSDIRDVAFTQILVDGTPWVAGDVVPYNFFATFRAGVITVEGP